ncbi:hypothetical protein [Haloferula rosea]|uniref:Uncharacterized protein n=1 Tax=Haloferula rosea TaxID=490093 RepID=A0A934RAH3_9BACT|nr:hypothetical protein [Haloferula rosea]MBK1827033.1 hypothetical protein [Haloferula rosea]
MKPAIVPIVCGAALAIMAGAATTHFASVQQIIQLAGNPTPASIAPLAQPGDTEAMIARLQQENQSLQGTLANSRAILSASTQGQHAPQAAPTTKTEQLLAELVSMNRELRNQVAETNRDLMELQFRVDTHSEQFRPLNVTEQSYSDPLGPPEYDTSIGVLPPMDMQ